jgi:uncharacterized protein (DUF1330 family)
MREASRMPEILCVLLWAHPGQGEALGTYEDRVLELIPDHGGRVLQRGRVLPSGDRPTEVQFLSFPSSTALDSYMNDPRRLALAAERDLAIARTEIYPLIS